MSKEGTEHAEATSQRRITILSVDDNPYVLEILSSLLQAAGCKVLTTADSYEAWALLHNVPVDVFTQDSLRPGLDGREFLPLVRGDKQLDGIALLMVTAMAQPEDRIWAYKQGADFYITKPFTSTQIFIGINKAMLSRGKSHLSIPEGLKASIKRPDIETSIEALKDRDSSVQLAAVNSLKWLEDTRAVYPLMTLLSHNEIEVRWAAIHTLGVLNDMRAVQPLITLLSGADILNRWAAALALGRLAAKEALEPLVAALADENSLVRMMATRGLGYLKEPGVVTSLRERLIDKDPMVVRAARETL